MHPLTFLDPGAVVSTKPNGRADNFRFARHSLITNAFDPQLIGVFLWTATTADHHLTSDDKQRNRLSDQAFQNWRLARVSMIFRGWGEILLDNKHLLI
jgi:hypothetical protein